MSVCPWSNSCVRVTRYSRGLMPWLTQVATIVKMLAVRMAPRSPHKKTIASPQKELA